MRSLLNNAKHQAMIEVMNNFILGKNIEFMNVLHGLLRSNPSFLISYDRRMIIPFANGTTKQRIKKVVVNTTKK